MRTTAQSRRARALERLGDNLQNRLSTAYLDIKRHIPIIGFMNVATNVSVHATISRRDNPDPATAQTAPVNVSCRVHADKDVPIRNGDVLTVKILDSRTGNWSGVYQGVAGNPAFVQSRQRVEMNVSMLGAGEWENVAPPPEIPTEPEPPPDPDTTTMIMISFLDENGVDIQPAVEYVVARGEETNIPALVFHGYKFVHVLVDGVQYDYDVIRIITQNPTYEVEFIYQSQTSHVYLRPLANAPFQTSEGVHMPRSLHWYRRLDFDVVQDDPLVVVITSPPLATAEPRITHGGRDRDVIRLNVGARVLVEPDGVVMAVQSFQRVQNGWEFTLIEVVPSQQELSAIVTTFYD